MTDLLARLDLERGILSGGTLTERHLSQLRDAFADPKALERSLARGNDPLIYTVSTIEHGSTQGDLHVGLGVLYPGRVGREFYLTRGHRHRRAEASEVYVGLRGTGKMILQNVSGTSVVDLLPQSTLYVPGHTDHRTVNTGTDALVYLGIYPAWAGHDYGSLSERPFSVVVVEDHGEPRILDREEFVKSLSVTH
jgi:glucose-6-phosphate isomerase